MKTTMTLFALLVATNGCVQSEDFLAADPVVVGEKADDDELLMQRHTLYKLVKEKSARFDDLLVETRDQNPTNARFRYDGRAYRGSAFYKQSIGPDGAARRWLELRDSDHRPVVVLEYGVDSDGYWWARQAGQDSRARLRPLVAETADVANFKMLFGMFRDENIDPARTGELNSGALERLFGDDLSDTDADNTRQAMTVNAHYYKGDLMLSWEWDCDVRFVGESRDGARCLVYQNGTPKAPRYAFVIQRDDGSTRGWPAEIVSPYALVDCERGEPAGEGSFFTPLTRKFCHLSGALRLGDATFAYNPEGAYSAEAIGAFSSNPVVGWDGWGPIYSND